MARQQRVQGVAQNERLCKLDPHFRHVLYATTANLKSKMRHVRCRLIHVKAA
jgi:hypothetical protein